MSEVPRRQTLTSFIPRQVMLETAAISSNEVNYKKEKKKKNRKDEILTVTKVEDEKKKNKKKKSSKERDDLLRSIADFLDSNGFVKTLSVFRSEARLEVNSRGGSCINLEDLFNNIIESSKTDPVASIEWSKEDAVDVSDVQIIDKKRKSKQISDSIGQENSEKNGYDATLRTEENTDYGKPLEVQKKKKHKVVLTANMGNVICLNVEEVTEEKIENLKDLTKNSIVETGDFGKDKGEKKKKMEAKHFTEQSDLVVNQKVIAKKANDGVAYASTKHQESLNSDNLVKELQENVDSSRKDNKKNKKLEKLTLDSLHPHNSDKLVEETSDRVGKHANDGLQKFGFKKDDIAISNENTTDVETTTNKKRRRSSSKEKAIQVENITAVSTAKQTKTEVAKEEKEACDQKVLTCTLNRESKKPSKALSSVVLDNHEENATLQDPQKQLSGDQLANGGIKKHQKEGSTRPKSMKKESRSGEPKVVNAFQRVKVDEIQFADERLQDNSYWALDDSGSGFGAKAQEVLGQVRGRDFRHEKTKKKRGAYRGGQINLQSHSIKFNNSDEE